MKVQIMRRIVTLLHVSLAALVLVIAFGGAAGCSTSSSDTAKACTLEGKQCQLDSECCTSFCELQGDKAYCQQDRGQNPGCSDERGPCTEDRHCCSGLCQDGSCIGNGSTCGRTNAACSTSTTCCSGYCIENTCQPAPQQNQGACVGEGGQCGQPTDCCAGFCVPTAEGGAVCVSQVSGGGGGGSNCGATGAYCRRASDCCNSVCTQTSSSGICR